jgi:hypothetical protein
MFFGTIGIVSSGGGSYPPYGTLLSSYCAFITDYDYAGSPWSGEFSSVGVYANGSGGTYTETIGTNMNGCYHPSGFVYFSEGGDLYLSWVHGDDAGDFAYGYDSSTTVADGAGGSYISSESGLYATNGQVVHSYEGYDYANNWPTAELLRFTSSGGPQLYTESVPAQGVLISATCSTMQGNDAVGTYWSDIPATYYLLADGLGGTISGYYADSNCGYYPNGYVTSYYTVDSYVYYTEQNGTNHLWVYRTDGYYTAYDSTNSTYDYSSTIFYAEYGYMFYSYYDADADHLVEYRYDGSDSYYITYNTNY